jgi:large subunit ribosomal protein L15
MPLNRRLPKRGFRRLQKNTTRRDAFAAVNLERFSIFADGDTVDPELMARHALVPSGKMVKVLADGELNRKLTVKAHAFSAKAREKIAAAGGGAELLST